MPVIVNDWLSSPTVRLMTMAERGAYWQILCYAWNEPDCSLPGDDAELALLSDGHCTPRVKACFIPDPGRPGRIYNVKQRALRIEQAARIENIHRQRTDAANQRWSKVRSDADRNATAYGPDMREHMRNHASSPVPPLPSLSVPTYEGQNPVNRAADFIIPTDLSEYVAICQKVEPLLPPWRIEQEYRYQAQRSWRGITNIWESARGLLATWKREGSPREPTQARGNQRPDPRSIGMVPDPGKADRIAEIVKARGNK
jgi:hypothetical protein